MYRSGNKRATIESFGDAVFGRKWQAIVEQTILGVVEQPVRNVDTFVQEPQGIQAWQFGPEQAAAICQPVLSVLGIRSTEFMKEGRRLLHAWFPETEDCDVPTMHLLQMQDPKGVA